MTPSATLILNPAAGRDQAADWADHLAATLRERFNDLDRVLTTGPGDAERAARHAAANGCERLFVGGGDGTLNEAVNGVASVPGGLARVTFGVVPLGTGNDFAAALGMPDDAAEAAEVLLRDRRLPVDVGDVNGRAFVNISGGGYIAEVSEAVTPQMKSIAGRLAYLVGGAQALIEFEPVRMTLSAEPGALRLGVGVYAFAVCNSRLIGGGRLIAPHAVIDDGLLDLCVIEAMGALEFVALLRRVSEGDHVEDPRVRYVRIERATLEFDRPIRVNTDGEVLEATRCEYRVRHRAATFVCGEPRFALASRQDGLKA